MLPLWRQPKNAALWRQPKNAALWRHQKERKYKACTSNCSHIFSVYRPACVCFVSPLTVILFQKTAVLCTSTPFERFFVILFVLSLIRHGLFLLFCVSIHVLSECQTAMFFLLSFLCFSLFALVSSKQQHSYPNLSLYTVTLTCDCTHSTGQYFVCSRIQ